MAEAKRAITWYSFSLGLRCPDHSVEVESALPRSQQGDIAYEQCLPCSLIIVNFVCEPVEPVRKIETHLFITQMPYLPLVLPLPCVSKL